MGVAFLTGRVKSVRLLKFWRRAFVACLLESGVPVGSAVQHLSYEERREGTRHQYDTGSPSDGIGTLKATGGHGTRTVG